MMLLIGVGLWILNGLFRYQRHGKNRDAIWLQDSADFRNSPDVVWNVFQHVRSKHEIICLICKWKLLQINAMIDAFHGKVGCFVCTESRREEIPEKRLRRNVKHA